MTTLQTLFKSILNVKALVVEDVLLEGDEGSPVFIALVHPRKGNEQRCPHCGRKCPRYDRLPACRWRALDCGAGQIYLQYAPCRITCPEHGVVRENIPWALGTSRFTRDFDMTVTWMALHLPKTAIQTYMRIDWDTVGRCIDRAKDELDSDDSRRLQNLVNIGIDETSYRKGYKYITVVVNHDTGELVWCTEGYGADKFAAFLDKLTPEQLAKIKVVTGDGARWIDSQMHRLPNATRCIDKFHVVQWITDALDAIRREIWQSANRLVRTTKSAAKKAKLALRKAKREGRKDLDDLTAAAEDAQAAFKEAEDAAKQIKGARYPLGKAFDNLTQNQRIRLEMIAASDKRLYRAYKLKETLRVLLQTNDVEAFQAGFKNWYFKATHSRIEQMKELALKIKEREPWILNTLRTGMSNARVEGMNSIIKLTIRKARGFRSVATLSSMLMLVCSKLPIPLPGRKMPAVARPA